VLCRSDVNMGSGFVSGYSSPVQFTFGQRSNSGTTWGFIEIADAARSTTSHAILWNRQKLRQLAIFWEDECAGMDQPGGWNILKRIYSKAIEYDPEYQTNYHSYSLSARTCVWPLERHSSNWKAILEDARGVCLTGIQKAKLNGMIWMSLGRIEYEFGDSVAALECFEESVEADNEQVMWAYLFRAHCLHDLERWGEAAWAYREVDRSFFDGGLSWRAVLVRDQLAHCLAESGNATEARAMFEKCFQQYEANPGLLELLISSNLSFSK